ncbi:MAG: zinc-binding dehydrogenase [Chloroflexota bacterium]
MKAVQVVARGKAQFVETAVPELKPDHTLIKTHRLSLCGSDIAWLHYLSEEKYPCGPGSTGHEMIGYVEKIGTSKTGDGPPYKIGDMVLAIVPDHGAMADYYLAPNKNVLTLPAHGDPEHLLQAQQLGTVIYACQKLPNLIGKNVVIIGQGSAGQWFNTMASRMGANRIIAVDLQAHRLMLSPQYGATHTIHNKASEPIDALQEITGGVLADVVIEAAGELESINLAASMVKHSGFMLQFGVPRAEAFPINYKELFIKCVTWQGIVHASREKDHLSTQIALQMIADGEVNVAPLLTHRFRFDQVLEAYALQDTRDEGAVKILIEMDG